MKRKNVGKLLVFSALTVISLCSCNPDKNSSGYTEKNVAVYVMNESTEMPERYTSMTLYFGDIPNLPYVSVDDFLQFFTANKITMSNNKGVFTFTNHQWSNRTYTNDNVNSQPYSNTATFDSSTNTITYADYACFSNLNPYALNPVDSVCGEGIRYTDDGTSYPLFVAKSDEIIYYPGSAIQFNLNNYSIATKVSSGKLYMPLYTAKTLFTTGISSFFYNGNYLFEDVPNNGYYNDYCSEVVKNLFTPTASYLTYAYNQIALDLDVRYGFKSFTRYNRKTEGNVTYKSTGKALLGDISNYNTLAKFVSSNYSLYDSTLDDGGHTGYTGYSYYGRPSSSEENESDYLYDSYKKIKNYKGDISEGKYISRSKVLVDNISNPTKATLVLDNFNEKTNDGLNKIKTFINQLNNKTGITQAIIDLSCNGGGYVYIQYLLTYYLTGQSKINYVRNVTNGSHGYVGYKVDCNFDHSFDSGDTIPSTVTTIDILTSNFTFSAANATACYVKKTGNNKFKFHGERSGGGISMVDSTMMNPLGMSAQWSSPNMFTYSDYSTSISNNIDDGIEPDGYKWNSHNDDGCKGYYNYYKDTTNKEV